MQTEEAHPQNVQKAPKTFSLHSDLQVEVKLLYFYTFDFVADFYNTFQNDRNRSLCFSSEEQLTSH